MSWTKRQLIDAAFAEIGLGSYSFDASPEQLQFALKRMDAMAAGWDGLGIRMGYPLPGSPESSNIDAETQVPDWAAEALFLNLAVALGPVYGKVTDIMLRAEAKNSKNAVMIRAAAPASRAVEVLPSGAGNKEFTDAFTSGSQDRIGTGNDGFLTFE